MANHSGENTKLPLGPLLLLEVALLVGPVVSFSKHITMHDQQRTEQIALLFLLASGSLWLWRSQLADMLAHIPKLAMRSWLFGLGLGAVSAISAEHLRFASLEWASLILLSWGAMTLAGQSKAQEDAFDRWAIRVVMLVAFFIALRAIINYSLVLHSGFFIDAGKIFGSSFGNPRFFGQAATLLLPIMAYPLLTGELSKFRRAALFTLLAVFWMLTLASATRGTLLGLACAAALLTLVSWRASQKWLALQGAGFIAGLALFAILFLWLPESAQHPGIAVENRLDNPVTLSKREIIWSLAWQQILAHPWLGIGPMHLAAIPNPVATHPHNALLQLAAEWGVPAMLALVAPLVYAMQHLLSSVRHQNDLNRRDLLLCLAASLLAATVQAMVDGVIVMPYTQTLLIFVIGWAVGVYFRDSASHAATQASLLKTIAIPLVLLMAMGLTAWGSYPEILHRAEITRNLLDHGVNVFNPRYWVHGWIP